MKRHGQLVFAACLAMLAGAIPAAASAAEAAVLAQDLLNVRASNKVTAALWTRRLDSYTLQVVLPRQSCSQRRAAAVATQAAAVTTQGSGAASQPAEGVDRSTFFIGNTIANLRGLDPTFGDCTLTLTDGRRSASGSSQQDSFRPAAQPALQPAVATPPSEPPKLQVWLLRADGTQIAPYVARAVNASEMGCGQRCYTNEMFYRFPLTEGAQAVAIAISVDDQYYIEKLRSLEPKSAAQ